MMRDGHWRLGRSTGGKARYFWIGMTVIAELLGSDREPSGKGGGRCNGRAGTAGGLIPPAGAKSPRANRQAQHPATNQNHRSHEIHRARNTPRRGRGNERGRRPLGRRDRKSELVARFGHSAVDITSARRKVNVGSAGRSTYSAARLPLPCH